MATNLSGWVNDPAEFIKLVHSLWGKRNDNQEALRGEVASLKAEIDRMRPKQEPQPQFVTTVDLIPMERPKREIAVGPKMEVVPKEAEIPPDIQVAQLFTQLASLNQLTEVKKKLEKEEFEGKLDPRTLDATGSLKWLDFIEGLPHKPWLTAYFINDGPNSVKVGINHPELLRQEIKINETLTISQEHAAERIGRLFYKCDAGETASVRVVGQW